MQDAAFAIGFRGLRPFVEYGEKALVTPLGIALRIKTEPGRLVGRQANAGVNISWISTPGQTFVARQVELAGGVVTGVAIDAALVEQGADFAPVIRRAFGGGGLMVKAGRISLAKALIKLE